MKKSNIAVVVGVLVVFGVGIYWWLGGFNSVEMSIRDRNNVKLLGLTYRGTPQDEGMVGTFQKVEQLLKNSPHSSLHTIYYTEPAGKLDTLQVFVGIEWLDTFEDKGDFEVKEISCSRVIVAEMDAHRLVMPTPKSVKAQIESFARENGLALQGVYVDQIIDRTRVNVIAPIAERKNVMGHLQ